MVKEGQRAVRDWRLRADWSGVGVMLVDVVVMRSGLFSGSVSGVAVLSEVEWERSLRQKA